MTPPAMNIASCIRGHSIHCRCKVLEMASLLFFLAVAVVACSGQDQQDMLNAELDMLDMLQLQSQAEAFAHAEEKSALLQQDLSKLWTATGYLPQLLGELEGNGSSNDTISPECVESAFSVWKSPASLPNVSIPDALLVILDASGKQGPGLLQGNTIWSGAYDECFTNTYTGYCQAELVTIKGNPLPLAWTVEFCVPKNCSSHDLAFLINSIDKVNVDESNVRCTKSKDPGYSAGAIVMVIVSVIFVLLALVGTVIDCLITNVPKYLKDEDEEDELTGHPSINSDGERENDPLLRRSVRRAEFKIDEKKKINPLDFITAFSLFKTVPTILSTKQAPDVITSLNGLRVISMFWVILGHTHFWLFSNIAGTIDNNFIADNVARRFSFQALISAFFSVDSFFFLSGVLVAYLTLRQMKRAKGRFPYLKFYIHRYLRLTPTYAFVLFFAWFVTVHLASGASINLKPPYATACEKYWWTNLLYINNLYPWKLADACVGWSWYLANDMQFYVLSPLILIPMYHLLPVGLVIGSVFVVVGAFITGGLSITYDFQANSLSLLAYGYGGNSKMSANMNYSDAIYIKPWDRIAPYVVGLVLGYILFKGVSLKKLRIPRLLKLSIYVAMWLVAAIVMLCLVYGLYSTWHHHVPKTFENTIYIVFSRFLWAMCLALIVFACHNGYGWFINSFLSMSIWTPLARLTFNAYLVHPIVMTVIYGQMQTSIHYTDITMAGYVIMFVVLSYAIAGVVCAFVEFPLGTIEMLVFDIVGRIGKPKKSHKYVDLAGEVKA